MSDLIHLTHSDGVGLLTLNRPEKRNAMTFAMLGEFIASVAEAGARRQSTSYHETAVPVGALRPSAIPRVPSRRLPSTAAGGRTRPSQPDPGRLRGSVRA